VESWKKYRDSLIINDNLFPLNEISSLHKSSLQEWEKIHIKFIEEWMNDSNFIEVKTSGSTGKPKILKIHKNAFVFSAKNTGKFLGLNNTDKALLCLPGNYIAGKMMIVRALVLGLNLHWQKPGSKPAIQDKYAFAAMTPMQVQNILLKNKSQLKNIQKLIIGGAPVNEFIMGNISGMDTEIYETYGMTETVSHIALKKINGTEKSEYFTVLPGINIEIDTRDCLTVTSDKLSVNNLKTNDIVTISDKNRFKWLGRIDNVINSGGVKLIPEQIEAKLKPFIKSDFFIFGLDDDLLTKVPAIIIEGNYNIDTKEFLKVLEKYEVPKKIFFTKRFARTESGKIQRNETIKMLALS